MRAPAIYSRTGGPGTLEITRLANCGMRSATLALPYSAVAASINQGMPSEGKSVGRMLLTLPIVLFIAAVAALTWAKRLSGSAIFVPRLTRLIDAWLSAVVSPFSRNEIGTAATSDLRGKLRRLAK